MKKNLLKIVIALVTLVLFACGGQKKTLDVSSEESKIFNSTDETAVEISDDDTEYEIIIIEPGFYTWLNSIARPEGYYSQPWLESRNQIMVTYWNQRVMQPSVYDPNLYQLQIDYDPTTDYGYDVNYKLYNYFIYFQRKYNQRLGLFMPRI